MASQPCTRSLDRGDEAATTRACDDETTKPSKVLAAPDPSLVQVYVKALRFIRSKMIGRDETLFVKELDLNNVINACVVDEYKLSTHGGYQSCPKRVASRAAVAQLFDAEIVMKSSHMHGQNHLPGYAFKAVASAVSAYDSRDPPSSVVAAVARLPHASPCLAYLPSHCVAHSKLPTRSSKQL